MYFNLIRLDYDQMSNKRRILERGAYVVLKN